MRLAVTHSWISRLFRETGSQSPGPSSRFWAALAAIRACTTYSRMATSTLEPGPASTSEDASSSKCSRDWESNELLRDHPSLLRLGGVSERSVGIVIGSVLLGCWT